jgi:hypothetical protein
VWSGTDGENGARDERRRHGRHVALHGVRSEMACPHDAAIGALKHRKFETDDLSIDWITGSSMHFVFSIWAFDHRHVIIGM